MPIYEYECDACGHRLEAIQKFSDAPLTDCPACAAVRLKKQVSAAAFRLKGSGWYETDFKGGGKKPDDKPDAGKDMGKDVAKDTGKDKSKDPAATATTGTTAKKTDKTAAAAAE